jgi:sugar diacid utilization regulator
VADDLAGGGALIHTLFEYAATDFNVKLAAQRLHVHHNTARYRLAKIEERTLYDLRRISEVIELLIAARTNPAPGRTRPG